jgi:hypothetical protein
LKIAVENYDEQNSRWPNAGRGILAQYDESSVVVYQAFRPSTGRYAAENQKFGPGFSQNRMTWIKPGFMWLMYRSNWGQSEGQETVLAIRIRRMAFDFLLETGEHSAFRPSVYSDETIWKSALAESDVRIQWDPDHGPSGEALSRRAIQLGLKGDAISRYSREWVVGIEDISDFVAEQRSHVLAGRLGDLLSPVEKVYTVDSQSVAGRLELDFGVPGEGS